MSPQIQAPAIDWLGCLRAAFHPLHLIEDDHVLLHNLPYMVHMSPIIGKWLNKHEPSNRYDCAVCDLKQRTKFDMQILCPFYNLCCLT